MLNVVHYLTGEQEANNNNNNNSKTSSNNSNRNSNNHCSINIILHSPEDAHVVPPAFMDLQGVDCFDMMTFETEHQTAQPADELQLQRRRTVFQAMLDFRRNLGSSETLHTAQSNSEPPLPLSSADGSKGKDMDSSSQRREPVGQQLPGQGQRRPSSVGGTLLPPEGSHLQVHRDDGPGPDLLRRESKRQVGNLVTSPWGTGLASGTRASSGDATTPTW